MTLSARNRLEGKVVEIQFGGVMAHVVVSVGKNLIESVITKRSADEMKLKVVCFDTLLQVLILKGLTRAPSFVKNALCLARAARGTGPAATLRKAKNANRDAGVIGLEMRYYPLLAVRDD